MPGKKYNRSPALQAKDDLNKAIDVLKKHGISVVCVIAQYHKKNARFSTRTSLCPRPDVGVDDNHIVLDMLREITKEWSNITHEEE